MRFFEGIVVVFPPVLLMGVIVHSQWFHGFVHQCKVILGW